LHYRRYGQRRADSYACVVGPAGCGGTAIKAGLLEEYVTGAVLDALESPRVQQALRKGEDHHAPRRGNQSGRLLICGVSVLASSL